MDMVVEFLGRTLLAAPFLVSAAIKSFSPAAAKAEIAELMARSGAPIAPDHALPLVIVVQFAGAGLLLAAPTAPLGAAVLLTFLIPVTLVAHAFWALPPANRAPKRDHFLANSAIAGGLLLVLKDAVQ